MKRQWSYAILLAEIFIISLLHMAKYNQKQEEGTSESGVGYNKKVNIQSKETSKTDNREGHTYLMAASMHKQ